MPGPLVGRANDLGAVDALLETARGELRLLVIEGPAGIGKSAVLREAMTRARDAGYRVLACHPAQAEARLSFAGLSDLLGSVEPAPFERLPAPQRHALDVALLRAEASDRPADQRTIGTAVVSLVRGLSTERPVLLAIDDAQWLDRPTARVLEFAIRRLEDVPVAVIVATRAGESGAAGRLSAAAPADRAVRIRLGGLSLGAMFELLREPLGAAMSRPVLAAIHASSRGNPFYALELARVVAPGGRTIPGARLPVPPDTRELVARRLERLPDATRDALVEVSALAQPTLATVEAGALEPAFRAGILSEEADGALSFSHPLFADAIYSAAGADRRRQVHAKLAGRVADLEEQARHRSLATSDPDEETAALLDRAAEHASARGAPEVAGELAELAATRTPAAAVDLITERLLRAARGYLRAGDLDAATALCERVLTVTGEDSVRARALMLLAEPQALQSPQAGVPFIERALTYVGGDVSLEAELEVTLGYLLSAGADPNATIEHIGRGLVLARTTDDTALIALATAMLEMAGLLWGRGVDMAAVAWALEHDDPTRDVPLHLRVPLIVAHVYEYTGEFLLAKELLTKLHAQILERGDEADLALVLAHLAGSTCLTGDLEMAATIANEAIRASVLTGQDTFRSFAHMIRALVRATAGDAAGAREDAAESLHISERIGWTIGAMQARWPQVFLALSEDDPATAVLAITPVVDALEALGIYEWSIAMALPDAIEAMIATGDLERTDRLIAALEAWGQRMDRPWALALSGRCRALHAAATGDLQAAQEAAERALEDHARLPMPLELGRTLLTLGQVLRRRGQRRAARERFEAALAIFDQVGAPLWAAKARTEVRRLGVRRAPTDLTDNEARVARLAASGLSNREIAAQMFLSRRTVEANLARAYGKLGIQSRAQLGALLARGDVPGPD